METKLDETFLLVFSQSSENFSGIQQMGVAVDSVGIVSQQGEINQETEPIAVDKEKKCQKGLDTCFR